LPSERDAFNDGRRSFAARQRLWFDAEIADALLGVALSRMTFAQMWDTEPQIDP